MIRTKLLSLGAVGLISLVAAGAAFAAGPLAPYRSPPVPSSASGLAFLIGYPSGWTIALTGERTRFIPPDAEGLHLARTFIEVDAFARDEQGAEAVLSERDGLARWVQETRPRYEIEDRRRVKVGPRGAVCDAVLAKDPARSLMPDRRELFVLVPAGDVSFVLRFAAVLADWKSLSPLFQASIESFEPIGG